MNSASCGGGALVGVVTVAAGEVALCDVEGLDERLRGVSVGVCIVSDKGGHTFACFVGCS